MSNKRVRIGSSMGAVGLVFLGLTAYRAGNDPLVLTLIAGLLAAAVLILRVPRLNARGWHLVVPVILALVFQAAALVGSGLGCAPPVGPPGSVFESFQLVPCTIRFSNSLYGLMQTWVVVAGAIVGLAAASAVSLRQISGFLIGACLALGLVHAVREVFDPIFLPTSAGFVIRIPCRPCWLWRSCAGSIGSRRGGADPLSARAARAGGLVWDWAFARAAPDPDPVASGHVRGALGLLPAGLAAARWPDEPVSDAASSASARSGGRSIFALQALAWVNRVGDIHGSLYERLSIYEQIATLWRKGILFGIGTGNFEIVFPLVNQIRSSSKGRTQEPQHISGALHRAGGIGFDRAHCAFGAVIVILLQDWWQRKSSVAGLGLAIVFAIAAHSVFDFSMEIPGVAASVAVMLGASSILVLPLKQSLPRRLSRMPGCHSVGICRRSRLRIRTAVDPLAVLALPPPCIGRSWVRAASGRDLHSRPTVSGGGIGAALAILAALLVLPNFEVTFPAPTATLCLVTVFAVTGFVDDHPVAQCR